MSIPAPFIHIRDLSFNYPGGNFALKHINLDVFPGERLALAGPNGAGKSTLARHLNGLLRPSSGFYQIGGTDTAPHTVAQLSGRTALLFQNPDDQICKRTVMDELSFGPKNLGYARDKVRTLIENVLDRFDLRDLAGQNPHDLNYSERKRIALASVVAMDTPVLVLDEPTAGLDPCRTAQLTNVLQNLTDQGKILILITHDMDFLAEQLPRIVCLNQGEIIFDGASDQLFARPDLMQAAGLYPPQMVRLSNHFSFARLAMTPEAFVSIQKTRCNKNSDRK